MTEQSTPLPAWLTKDEKGVFHVDIDVAYPLILGKLGVKEDKYDQYWVEVAYQCAKLSVQDIVANTEHDPRPDKSLLINMTYPEGDKDRWALASYPPGKGVIAATRGREAIDHYAKLQGRMTRAEQHAEHDAHFKRMTDEEGAP